MAELLSLLLLLLLLLPASTISVVSPNLTEFNATCARVHNFPIVKICHNVGNETKRLFGENFKENYLRDKVYSHVFTGLILEKCKPAEYCVHLSQAEPSELEDKLLIGWRDERIRKEICTLIPCLSSLPPCGSPERQLTFNSVQLLCSLTRMSESSASTGNPYCLEGALDLLQYAFADLRRNQTVEEICDCVGKSVPCLTRCRIMIYKYNCLNTQCLPYEKEEIRKFPAWRWYYDKDLQLKRKYNVTFCERPIETSETAAGTGGDKGPVIYAYFPQLGMSKIVLAVVLTVVLAALLMVGVTCVCWQKIFLSKYSRDRVQYSEVGGNL